MDEIVFHLAKRLFPEGKIEIIPIPGDGSLRGFFRIVSKEKSLLAITPDKTSPLGMSENLYYAYVGSHLKAKGVAVPEIVFLDKESAVLAVEDLGDTRLYDLKGDIDEDTLLAYYLKALHNLVRLQYDGPLGFDPSGLVDPRPYDQGFVYERELLYFKKAFLKDWMGLDFDEKRLHKEFELLAEMAGEERPRFLIHRDFQSRNLMVKEKEVFLIDFQGVRFGPPQYDLAALVIDPYMGLSEELKESLIGSYLALAKGSVGLDEEGFREKFLWVALARNLQVLAAFAFLSKEKGRRGFSQYIPTALFSLKRLLDKGLNERLPLLDELASISWERLGNF